MLSDCEVFLYNQQEKKIVTVWLTSVLTPEKWKTIKENEVDNNLD